MILINQLEIQNNGDNIYLDVETNIGSTITSILLWNLNTFKDYTQAIDLSDKIIGTSNIEQIEVTADELDIIKFEDIWFVEITSSYTDPECNTLLDPALGITYNLNPYYNASAVSKVNAANSAILKLDKSLPDASLTSFI